MFSNHKSVAGPVLLAQDPSKGLYFLGEHHHINGTTDPSRPHVLDVLFTSATNSPKDSYVVIMEGNAKDLSMYSSLAAKNPSPMKVLASRILRNRGMDIPNNMKILLADVRRDALFRIFESVYDFETYVDLWIPKDEEYVTNARAQYKKSKVFEKDLLHNGMANRKKCVAFIMSLIDPDTDYPVWFKNHVDVTLPNRIKEAIAALHKNTARTAFLQNLRLVLTNMLNETIAHNSNYSLAMKRAQDTYRPGSQHFVTDKYRYFNAFMIVLTSIFMDFYSLALIIEASQSATNVIFIGGVNHMINIAQYLGVKGMVYTKNAGGNLDLTQLNEGLPNPRQVRKSPRSLLRNFLEEPNFININP